MNLSKLFIKSSRQTHKKRTKVDIKPPGPFVGRHNKKTLDKWLFQLDIYFDNLGLPKPKTVALTTGLLKDTAFLVATPHHQQRSYPARLLFLQSQIFMHDQLFAN